MRLNSTLALTLILLTLMVGAGVVSATWAYALGREALKGITQPEARPNSSASNSSGNAPRQEELVILPEAEILADVKARMSGNGEEAGSSNSTDNSTDNSQSRATTEAESAEATSSFTPVVHSQAGLPITSEDEGVTLQVRSVRQQEGYLLLDVSLQNDGSRSIQFLYSFMNVTDNRGRAFSANTEGLPGQLPPNGESYSGVVSIPIALLDEAENLSLTLTDYPDQQLQLQMSDIPVVR